MVPFFGGCSVELLDGLPDSEASIVLRNLQQAGIPAERQRSAIGNTTTCSISVPRADAPMAWQVLHQAGLPRTRPRGLAEVFGSGPGLVPSAARQRALMQQALAGELTRTLEETDGVIRARVHLALPDPGPSALGQQLSTPARASVLLVTRGRPPLGESQVQRLVAGAVPGLQSGDVAVVFLLRSQELPALTRASASATLEQVGPFQVAARSRPVLQLTLVALLGLLAGAGLAVFFLVRRNRALVHELREARSSAPSQDLSRDLESSLELLNRSLGRGTGQSLAATRDITKQDAGQRPGARSDRELSSGRSPEGVDS